MTADKSLSDLIREATKTQLHQLIQEVEEEEMTMLSLPDPEKEEREIHPGKIITELHYHL